MKNNDEAYLDIEAIIECDDCEEDIANNLIAYMHENGTKCLPYTYYDWFERHERCCECGSSLEYETYEEHHTELFGSPIEYISEAYCPNCEGDLYEFNRN